MSKTYSAGIVTAYGAAKRAGYQGTYEDFCRQQAGYAENAATVEQAKQTAVSASQSADQAKQDALTARDQAQTAKAQTEQSASQALTDIETARTGAISAVQTAGQTQTANATAQAQAAATSANTASTKASEASASATTATTKATEAAASATSAAQSASNAQAVLESIPEDYSDLSEDVDQLKADLGDVKGLDIAVGKANNLIKRLYLIPNEYIFTDGTVRKNSSAFYRTDYIEIEPSTKYIGVGTGLSAFYDSNYDFISPSVANFNGAVTSPATAKYVRVSIPVAYIASCGLVMGETLPTNLDDGFLNIDGVKEAVEQLYDTSVLTGNIVQCNVKDAGYIDSISPVATIQVNGSNWWNEEYETGTYGLQTGNYNTGSSNLCSKHTSPIPVKPNTQYYWCYPVDNRNTVILFYKSDQSYQGTYITVQNGGTFTTPADAYFIKFYCVSQYGTIYGNDIQLALNTDPEKDVYHSYNGSTNVQLTNIALNAGNNYVFAVGETVSITAKIKIHNNYTDEYKKEYEAGYIHFTVPVNQNIVDNSLTTNALIDNENSMIDVDCILSLPTSYRNNGAPSKLIMLCHGAGRGVYGAETAFDDQGDWRSITGYNNLVSAFNSAGYAVFDCNGYANTRYGCSFWGAQRGIEAWRKAYDYVVKNYNVEENVSIYGFSMGGCTALNLVMRNFPNVKCIAVGSPVTTLDETCYARAGTAFNEAWGITEYNSAILRGNDPMQTVITIDNIDYCFKTLPPLKIWFGSIETWPSPSDAQRLVNAIKNAGGKADLRICEGRGHGLSYGEVQYVVDEIVMYINRFNY